LVHKTPDEDKQKWGAMKNGQSRETGNIWYIRHRMKTNNTEGQWRMDNPEKLATFGTQDTGWRQGKLRGNQEWTIQRNWKHLVHKTQDEDNQNWGAIKNGQSRETDNIGYTRQRMKTKKTEGQWRMDNPEKLATFGTQDTGWRQGKLRGNQEWTIQRNWQHLVHKTQDEDNQNWGAIKNGQSRETDNIGYTRHRMKTNKTEGQWRMDNPEKLATFGTQDTGWRQTKLRGNQEWTIQRNWQHWVHKTHDEDKQNWGAMKNGQSRETGNIWYTTHRTKTNKTEGQSRMDNPEKLTTFGTQDTWRRQTKLRGNEEWTIQSTWQHLVHKTQDEDKQHWGAMKNGQSRETGNTWYTRHRTKTIKTEGQSRMDNPEKLTTLGTQDRGWRQRKLRGNEEWTIQRNWQHLVHKTQDEDKEN
jgi:hypothetical protein